MGELAVTWLNDNDVTYSEFGFMGDLKEYTKSIQLSPPTFTLSSIILFGLDISLSWVYVWTFCNYWVPAHLDLFNQQLM